MGFARFRRKTRPTPNAQRPTLDASGYGRRGEERCGTRGSRILYPIAFPDMVSGALGAPVPSMLRAVPPMYLVHCSTIEA